MLNLHGFILFVDRKFFYLKFGEFLLPYLASFGHSFAFVKSLNLAKHSCLL